MGVPGIVAKRATELGDDAGEGVVGDGGLLPDRVEELLLGNQAVRVVEQVAEHLERLRFELHQLVSPPYPFGREIDADVTERQEIAGRHHEIISRVDRDITSASRPGGAVRATLLLMILRAITLTGLLFTAASYAAAPVAEAATGAPAPATAASTSDSTRTVGIEVLDDKLVLVRVMVNGAGPHLFLLDTGGASTVVSDTLARQLGLIPSGSHRIDTMSGSRTVGLARVDELRLGGETFTGVEVLWMDLANLRARDPRIQGVIGQDLLRTRSFLLDYEARRLTFDPDAQPPTARVGVGWPAPAARMVGRPSARARRRASRRAGRREPDQRRAALRDRLGRHPRHPVRPRIVGSPRRRRSRRHRPRSRSWTRSAAARRRR